MTQASVGCLTTDLPLPKLNIVPLMYVQLMSLIREWGQKRSRAWGPVSTCNPAALRFRGPQKLKTRIMQRVA